MCLEEFRTNCFRLEIFERKLVETFYRTGSVAGAKGAERKSISEEKLIEIISSVVKKP